MIIKTGEKEKHRFIIFALMCTAAGIANGLLGAGGGILYLFALNMTGKDLSDEVKRSNYGSTVAAVFPLSLVSSIVYGANSSINLEKMWIYAIPAAAGGICGALLLGVINTSILKKLFGALVIFAGINMILR